MSKVPCFLGALALVALQAVRASVFFVSPDGDDSAPGTEAKPFRTPARAQAAARQAKDPKGTTVTLRGGTYYLADTLVFTSADSGTLEAPVVWQASKGETPVLSGGTRLDLRWEPFRDGILKAQVPEGFTTDQLFVDGERQVLARYPDFDPAVRILGGYSKDAFGPARAARWADPRGGFIHAMHQHMWGDFHYAITGKDASGAVTYEGGWQNNRRMGMHPEHRFVENLFEELDAPGEWFLDAKARTLYFQPRAGKDMAKAVVEGVRLRHLVEFRGDERDRVTSISLKGITFRHTARTFMDNKEPLLRSDWTTYRGGAVWFRGAMECSLEDSVIDQVGGHGVFVDGYNRHVTLRGCEIVRAGGNGIAFVGRPGAVQSPLFEYGQVQDLASIQRTPGPRSQDYPGDCLVDDCLIYLSGRVEKQTAGVQIAMSRGIRVRDCSIYDVPRAGINIGDGCWGGHIIEGCDIFDTVKETGDHGSFNSWGRDRFWRPDNAEVEAWVKEVPGLPLLDTVRPVLLQNNRWRCDHGWDIDLDDGTSNYIIRDNLCLKGGLKNREGYHRVVENNVIVGNSFHPHVWYKDSQDVFRHNIVFTPYQPIRVGKPWGKEVDSNLLHAPGAPGATPAKVLQEQSGRDERSVVADARFIDPSRGDYRVKDGSPALALGFRNFPMDRFGVRSPRLRAKARTPELPGAARMSAASPGRRDGRVVGWLGGQIKEIVGDGEVSAAGLPGEIGVGIVSVPAGSVLAKAGLREGDVVLRAGDQEIVTRADLAKAFRALRTGGTMPLEIFRSQKRTKVELVGVGGAADAP